MTTELKCITLHNGDKHYRDAKNHLVRVERPNGYSFNATYDDRGNRVTYNDSLGYSSVTSRYQFGNVLAFKNSKGDWETNTTDDEGNILIHRNSTDNDYEQTFDENNNKLTYKDSKGNWLKLTRDSDGAIKSYESNDGVKIILASDEDYYLHYEDEMYVTESIDPDLVYYCYDFSYEEAVEHWTVTTKQEDPIVKARAIVFLAAIEKHQSELKGNNHV